MEVEVKVFIMPQYLSPRAPARVWTTIAPATVYEQAPAPRVITSRGKLSSCDDTLTRQLIGGNDMVPDRKFNDTFSDYAKIKKCAPKKVKASCERCIYQSLPKIETDVYNPCPRCVHNIIHTDNFYPKGDVSQSLSLPKSKNK